MTRRYLDTSIVVSLLTNEARSSDVRLWIDRAQSESFLVSSWVRAEFAAALSMKMHRSQIPATEYAASLSEFIRMQSESLTLLGVDDRHFEEAAKLAARSIAGLRAGDALHLAIAADHGATICTLDKRMAKAGVELGLPTELV